MTHYEILGIPNTATAADIRAAYRHLAQHLHPDRSGGHARAHERFAPIADAHAVLADAERRRRYDASLVPSARGGRLVDAARGVVADFLAGWNVAASRRTSRQGDDVHVTLPLSFEVATLGGDREVELPLRLPCLKCGGRGGLSDPPPLTCHLCAGSGTTAPPPRERSRRPALCPLCSGRGLLHPRLCSDCDAQGVVTRHQRLSLTIPACSEDGRRLRVVGRGAPGVSGGPPGHLFVTLRVAPHPLLRREGADLHVDLPLTLTEFALGGELTVPTLEGRVTVEFAPGKEPRRVLRLRGRGAPDGRGGRGDLLVHLEPEPPVALDEAQQAALRNLERTATARTYPVRTRYESSLESTAREGSEPVVG